MVPCQLRLWSLRRQARLAHRRYTQYSLLPTGPYLAHPLRLLLQQQGVVCLQRKTRPMCPAQQLSQALMLLLLRLLLQQQLL
jgi:hypothetical protein